MLYDDICRILKDNREGPGLESFWSRDKISSPEEVAAALCTEPDKKPVRAFEAAGFLFWSYGKDPEDIETGKQFMVSGFLSSEGKQQKKFKKYVDQIEQEMKERTS